jgi:hypothetical protein
LELTSFSGFRHVTLITPAGAVRWPHVSCRPGGRLEPVRSYKAETAAAPAEGLPTGRQPERRLRCPRSSSTRFGKPLVRPMARRRLRRARGRHCRRAHLRSQRTGGASVDVDAGLRLSQRPHTDSRLRADARGCHGGVRQELAAVKCSGPSGGYNLPTTRRLGRPVRWRPCGELISSRLGSLAARSK